MENILWTDYLKYRAKLGGFELKIIEEIVRYGSERYFDTSTDRNVVVGKHKDILVLIPYDMSDDNTAAPVNGTCYQPTAGQLPYQGWKITKMSDPKLSFFPDVDILHLSISEEPGTDSVEISPDVTAELNDKGELIGIEIIGASSYLRDSILETTQAKLLELSKRAA